MNQVIKCSLCQSVSSPFSDGKYCLCEQCGGIFLPRNQYPDAETEKARYEEHNNDINDLRYQQFVSPITTAVMNTFSTEHKGLDFGAGTGPVISKLLNDHGYSIQQYDPYFHPYPELLKNTYDYIVSCEVIEHFFDPLEEFRLLKRLLNPGGALYCMTNLYHESIHFPTWYYRRDPTHVFIYQQKTLFWIKEEVQFSTLKICDKHFEFWK